MLTNWFPGLSHSLGPSLSRPSKFKSFIAISNIPFRRNYPEFCEPMVPSRVPSTPKQGYKPLPHFAIFFEIGYDIAQAN